MIRFALVLWATGSFALAAGAVGLDTVRAEPDLERRASLALDFAREQVRPLIDTYLDGNPEEAAVVMRGIEEACRLAWESLQETGKHPRKKPKHFKKAEIDTRKLVARLREAQKELTFEEGLELEPLIERIEEINSQLLLGIMSKK